METFDSNEKRGFVQYLTGAVMSPKDTIGQFIDYGSKVPMALFFMLFNFLMFLPIMPKIKEFTLWTLENSTQKIPPEQLEMTKQMLPYLTWGQAALAFISPLIMWFVISLAVKFFNLFIGGEAPLKKLMPAAIISSIPVYLGGVIKTALIMITPAQNMQGVSTSLALLLPKGQMGFLYGFLSAVDPFTIWSLYLLAIGGAYVLQTSVKKTGVFLGVLWSVYAVSMGVTMIFSGQSI